MLAGAIWSVLSLASVVLILRYAPAPLWIPLVVFVVFYVLTTAIGASVLAVPLIRDLWAATYPTMDSKWISPGDSAGYWLMVWGPLPLTGAAALLLYPYARKPATVVARLLGQRVDLLAATLVATAMCVYCWTNLGVHGYLGVSLLNSDLIGLYRENILLRTEMFTSLGTLHFAAVYMGIPAIAILAYCNAVRSRTPGWWLLFVVLALNLFLLYSATLTKANVLVFGIQVVIAAQILGVVGARGLLLAAVSGVLVLTVLSALLSGIGALDLALTGYNIIFREASDVPFYLAVFPAQLPFIGIDLGLGAFGLGPTVASNFEVANFMYPHETWVQGAAPAAAHVMAYGQAGYPWALVTMVLMGLWIAFTGQLRRWVGNPVVFSAFIGAVTTCYYLTQVDFVGAFNVSYGYKWWLAALLLLLAVQRMLSVALRAPQPAAQGGAA